MRLIITIIAVAIITVGLMNRCSNRQPMLDLGYDGSTGTKHPQKIVQKSGEGDNTIVMVQITYPDTTAVKTLLGDTLYLRIKLAPDTIE